MQINEIKERYLFLAKQNKQELTVFMTAHNRENYIAEAIEGALNNTYKNFCLIVLDNCSTDGTRYEVEKYEKLHENVFYIYRESLLHYTNFQFAVDFCTTPYFMVLHDDDIILPNCIDILLGRMKESHCAAISSSEWLINEKGIRMEKQNDYLKHAVFFKNDEYLKNYLQKDRLTMCYPTTMYRSDFLKNNPEFYDFTAGPCIDDYSFFQIGRLGGTIGILPDKLINYRLHSGQDSTTCRKYMYLQFYDFLLNDPYYKKILNKNKRRMLIDTWASFKCLFFEYNSSKISYEEYISIFSYPCVKFALRSWDGIGLLCLMKGIIKGNSLVYMVYKQKKRGKK